MTSRSQASNTRNLGRSPCASRGPTQRPDHPPATTLSHLTLPTPGSGEPDFGVTHPEIVVACWYATEQHPRAMAWASWRAWVGEWFSEMWSNNYDAVPLPPVVDR